MKQVFSAALCVLTALFICAPVDAQPAATAWPMFRHDARHTGASEYSGPAEPILSWSYRTGNDVWSSPAMGSGGEIYVGSIASHLYTFTPAGAFSWSYRTGDSMESSPAVGSGGKVYVGSNDNRLYSFTSAGVLSWSYRTGDWLYSSPALAADGRLIIGSNDNNVYCIGPTATQTSTPPIDLTANKTTFSTTDRIEVLADAWPIPVPCYPFVRVLMADGSILYYERGKGFMPSPVPYLGFKTGAITIDRPYLDYPVLSANFTGIATGLYVLEGGAVDATQTTSADNLIYFGSVDRETLNVQ